MFIYQKKNAITFRSIQYIDIYLFGLLMLMKLAWIHQNMIHLHTSVSCIVQIFSFLNTVVTLYSVRCNVCFREGGPNFASAETNMKTSGG